MPTSILHLPFMMAAAQPSRLRASNYSAHSVFRIRWSDLQDGRVSRVAMAHFFEDMRVIMMRELLGERFGTSAWRAVARAISIEHLASARINPPNLELVGGISGIGKSSYTFALGAFQNGCCVALGDAVGVRVDENSRISPLDAQARAMLERYRMRVPKEAN